MSLFHNLLKRFLAFTPYSVVIILAAYNIFFTAYALQKHAAFQTAGFDLGVWDQMTWNTLHGRPFWSTQHAGILYSLGFHVEPVLLLLFPLYGLYNGPETMIVFQTLAVSIGALPIYWFAREKISHIAGLIFVLVYLLYPALEAAVTFDVHSLTLAVPILAYALWAMYTERYRLFVVMALLAISCKEDISLLVLMMGLYLVVVKREVKTGLVTICLSLLWFFVAIYIIIPQFRPDSDNEYVYRYLEWGNNFNQIALNIITQPGRVLEVITAGDKALYWIRVTMPGLFIALLDPVTLLLVIPTLLLNTLGNYPAAYQLDLFHNSAPLAVYVTFATINGLVRIQNFVQPRLNHVHPEFFEKLLLALIFLVTVVYQIQFGHTPIGRYFKWPIVTEHHLQTTEMLQLIPPQAGVASQNGLAARLGHRQWLFILPNISYNNIEPDYIAVNMQGNFDIHGSLESYCQQLTQLLNQPDYGLIYAEDGLLLFQRDVADGVSFQTTAPCLS